eukprot:s3845_g3.t1
MRASVTTSTEREVHPFRSAWQAFHAECVARKFMWKKEDEDEDDMDEDAGDEDEDRRAKSKSTDQDSGLDWDELEKEALEEEQRAKKRSRAPAGRGAAKAPPRKTRRTASAVSTWGEVAESPTVRIESLGGRLASGVVSDVVAYD